MDNRLNKAGKGLRKVRVLLDELNSRGVKYCHWKSNEHLDASLRGDTDLDILFHEDDSKHVEKILNELGFLRFKTAWHIRYPYIVDYLALDARTARLVHVHAHYRLVLGEKRLKSYRMPWEENILQERKFNDAYGTYCSDPAHELLLLLIRVSLKNWPGYWSAGLSEKELLNACCEFQWLKSRVTSNELQAAAASLIGSGPISALNMLYDNGLKREYLAALKREVAPLLRKYQRYGRLNRYFIYIVKNVGYYLAKASRKTRISCLPIRRTRPGEGMIISLMGADGSGKSTQSKSIVNILSAKMDVLPLYMGSGDGQASVLRAPIDYLRSITKGTGRKNQRGSNDIVCETGMHKWEQGKYRSMLFGAGKIIWALTLALEKRGKLKYASRSRKMGLIVICDRYPQIAIQGFNDGPILYKYENSRSFLLRWLYRWEKRCYSTSQVVAPDLVVKLLVDPAVLHSRRPEMQLNVIMEKQAGIKCMRFPECTTMMEVDAGRPPEEVTVAVLNAINSRLSSSNCIHSRQ